MKRVLLHIIFWIGYLFQDILLIYFLNTTRFNLSHGTELMLSIENTIVILLPKLLFTYFMLYVVVDKIAKSGIQNKSIVHSIIALAAALFLYRGLVVYFVNPEIDGLINTLPFFYPLGFLVALMDIGFASGTAIIIKQVRLQLQEKEKEKNLIRDKLETELKFLRHQNPSTFFV